MTRQPLSDSETVAWQQIESRIAAFELRPHALDLHVGDRFPLELLSVVPLDADGNEVVPVVGGVAATGFSIELPQGTRAVGIEQLDLVARSPGDFTLWIQPLLADRQKQTHQLALRVSVSGSPSL